jgi:phage terminase small subunit
MAGVKGKSGGPRKNAGGARPGAGRKQKEKPVPVVIPADIAQVIDGEPLDPRPALEKIALGLLEVTPQQYKALTALLPYVHAKKGDGGKKDEKANKAKQVASRFSPAAPPKLVAAGGKKV